MANLLVKNKNIISGESTLKVKYMLFDNDQTLYKPGSGFKEAVIGSMIPFLAQKLQISESQVTKERERLITKYGHGLTEFVFCKEYGIGHDEFAKATYLSIPMEKYGISYDVKLQSILQNIDIPKAVLTNNSSEFARKVLKSLGVEQLFEYVIGSNELDYNFKPDKEAFIRAIAITNSNPKEMIFVDDNAEFLRPAKELGMTTVLIEDKGNQRNKDYIDYKIKKIYDIEQILRKK